MNVQFHPSGFAASEQLKEFIEKYDEFIIEMPQGKEFKVILLKL